MQPPWLPFSINTKHWSSLLHFSSFVKFSFLAISFSLLSFLFILSFFHHHQRSITTTSNHLAPPFPNLEPPLKHQPFTYLSSQTQEKSTFLFFPPWPKLYWHSREDFVFSNSSRTQAFLLFQRLHLGRGFIFKVLLVLFKKGCSFLLVFQTFLSSFSFWPWSHCEENILAWWWGSRKWS